jgi:hypothetical protein
MPVPDPVAFALNQAARLHNDTINEIKRQRADADSRLNEEFKRLLGPDDKKGRAIHVTLADGSATTHFSVDGRLYTYVDTTSTVEAPRAHD